MTHLIALLAAVTLTLHDPNYTQNGVSYGTCTAVIVAPNLALTAGHCIEEAVITNPLMVEDNHGTKYEVKLKAYDADSDLALLSLPKKYSITAKLGPTPHRGDKVETYNSGHDYTGTYNEGIVCNFIPDRDLPIGNIMTNITILGGASGGGLFNQTGELVGINRWGFDGGLSAAIDTTAIVRFLKANHVKY